jgi:hypothetical protein
MPATAVRLLDPAARERCWPPSNEGQGLWTLAVLTAANVGEVRRCAVAGDLVAARALVASSVLLGHPSPPPCLTCGTAGRRPPPAAIIVLTAAVDTPMRLFVSVICVDCWAASGTDAHRRAAVLNGLCQHYGMEGLRVLQPMAAAGHA